MTHEQADILLFYLQNIEWCVPCVNVYDRTADATIHYNGDRDAIIEGLRRFRYDEVEVPRWFSQNSGRALNAEYQEKLVNKLFHYGRNCFCHIQSRQHYTTRNVGEIYLERASRHSGPKD